MSQQKDTFGKLAKLLVTLEIGAAATYTTFWIMTNGVQPLINSIRIPPYWQGVINVLMIQIAILALIATTSTMPRRPVQ